MMHSFRRNALVLALGAALIQGCGGGGGSANDFGVSTSPFPVDSVITALATNGIHYQVRSDQGDTMTVDYVPGAGQFTRREAHLQNGVASSSSETINYLSSPFSVTASINQDAIPLVIKSMTPPPATATVGEHANLVTGSQGIYNVIYHWEIQPRTATTADVCVGYMSDSGIYWTETDDCFQVDVSGRFLGARAFVKTHLEHSDFETVQYN